MAEKQRENDMDALKTDVAALREHIASLAASVKKIAEEKKRGVSSAADREDPKGEGALSEKSGIADGRIFNKNSKRRAPAAKKQSRTLSLK